jgi:hypothetical protein
LRIDTCSGLIAIVLFVLLLFFKSSKGNIRDFMGFNELPDQAPNQYFTHPTG